jgi:hypothetical protein
MRAGGTDHRDFAVGFVARHFDQGNVQNPLDFLGYGCENLGRRRLLSNERRYPPKGGVLISQLAEIVFGALRLRQVTQCSTDEQGLAFDAAQRKLNRELAPVGAHARQLEPAPEHPFLTGLDEPSESSAVALA